ncbi:MAG: RdgB/HAM1 family non-canonical purine NTP pyrophosphatase [Planctomycetia bacterium]|nr:RdgB/HAM1 family non-canonical purine NTP pyrophosphatase [Planctomycetia bacterium]
MPSNRRIASRRPENRFETPVRSPNRPYHGVLRTLKHPGADVVDEILLASGNPHKLEEVRAVLEPIGLRVIGLDELETVPEEPDEDGVTFEANARIKAIAYARATGRVSLADDSGLEVDALGGEPGVRSARWSGVEGEREVRDAANNRKLVESLRAVPEADRAARFVCAMCLASPDGTVLAETRGTFDGTVILEPRGGNGFGYDPYLLLPDEDRTSAELSPAEKNVRSHRGVATRAMAPLIEALGRS